MIIKMLAAIIFATLVIFGLWLDERRTAKHYEAYLKARYENRDETKKSWGNR